MLDPSTTTTFVGPDLAGVMGCYVVLIVRVRARREADGADGFVGRPRPIVESPPVIRAVLWDFGGVILSSPFEAFRRYEAEHEIPLDFIRGVNATNPDVNAWARLERAELDHEGFDVAFADGGAGARPRGPGRRRARPAVR